MAHFCVTTIVVSMRAGPVITGMIVVITVTRKTVQVKIAPG